MIGRLRRLWAALFANPLDGVPDVPLTVWVPIVDATGRTVGTRATHTGPCVFIDEVGDGGGGQCPGCGRLNIGIVRA